MRISGNITINRETYKTDIKDMEELEELGNGTCGHVIKMKHKPSGEIIAVKVCLSGGAERFLSRCFLAANAKVWEYRGEQAYNNGYRSSFKITRL